MSTLPPQPTNITQTQHFQQSLDEEQLTIAEINQVLYNPNKREKHSTHSHKVVHKHTFRVGNFYKKIVIVIAHDKNPPVAITVIVNYKPV